MIQTTRMLLGPLAVLYALSLSPAFAADAPPPEQAAPPPSYGGPQKKVSIDQLKKQYWNQGGELDVVQNRIYSKAHKFELDAFGGFVSTDPFLSVKALGGSLGYYLSETFSIRAMAWKDLNSRSQALAVLEDDLKVTANTNIPSAYYGGEAGLSLIYGKLSLLSRYIMYYDLHAYLGLGMTKTETGTNFTQSVGLGQQIFISQSVSLRLDYRMMQYRETPRVKYAAPGGAAVGTPLATRSNFTNVILVGVGFLL